MRSFMTMKGYGALMSSVEVWKDIENYEGLYQVSNLGRVRSLDRVDANKHYRKGRVIAYSMSSSGLGYRQVSLWRDGKRENRLIHRIVASAFLDNYDNLPQVNHKDENKENNTVSNLEWCSALYNVMYGTRNERMAKTEGRPVYVIANSGHRYLFRSVKIASELLGLDRRAMHRCLKDKHKHHHGFSFELAV